MELWIVGKRFGDYKNRAWEFQGVFDSETLAVQACVESDYFIGPANLNEPLADASFDWPGAYYPLLKKA